MKTSRMFALFVGLATLSLTATAQEFANVEYLCADWGPAMTLSPKTNEPPRFSETEDEIYFLKQVTRFTRKKLAVKDVFNGRDYEDVGHGINIYLCKMKPDGSGKTEIKELWHNVAYPIDTQAQSTWMDVSRKTRRIALSIVSAGSDLIGLWKMSLDGSGVKQIIAPSMEDQHLLVANNPSWTPDGEWIVMGWGRGGRIAKCDKEGTSLVHLRDGTGDCQPRVSPDGKTIAYVHIGDAKTGGLYLMDIDGRNAHMLPNPDDKYKGHHSGTYPAWSPDGKRIYALGAGIIDVASGQRLNSRRPLLAGKPWAAECAHWGKLGLLGSATGFRITLTDAELQTVKLLAVSVEEQLGVEPSNRGPLK